MAGELARRQRPDRGFAVSAIAGLSFAVAFGLGACSLPTAFVCSNDEECGAGGRCEISGYCSFLDELCPQGRRYGALASERLGGECVGDEVSDGSETRTSDGPTGDGDGDSGGNSDSDSTGDGDGDGDTSGDGDGDGDQVDPCDGLLVPPGMVCVPGGSFISLDTTFHTIETLFVDVGEVSVAAYTQCVIANNCTAGSIGGECNTDVQGREDHPINCVLWSQADEFCTALDKRLPSEWEWQWFARGGDAARSYPWGEQTPDCTRAVMLEDDVSGCGLMHTDLVGSRSPSGDSRHGLNDLAGNVWEWTASWLDEAQLAKVVRGGAWDNGNAQQLRTDDRSLSLSVQTSGSAVGMRCVSNAK